MKHINCNVIEKEASQNEFILSNYEKIARLIIILDEMNHHSSCSTLVLKGGTAINIGILPLPRVSADIDLNYIGSLDKDTMKKERVQIQKTIYQFMTKNGYKFDSRNSKSHYSLDSYFYDYTTIKNSNDSLKIEINYSLRSLIFEPVQTSTTITINGEKTKILMEDPIETYASKIVALLTRAKPRDLFDVNLMLKKDIFDVDQLKLLKKCVIFYHTIGSRNKWSDLTLCHIDSIDTDSVKKHLIPILPKNTEFDIEEAKKQCKKFLTDVLILSPQEEQFIVNFENKNYIPELLFSKDIAERIRAHPIALWRCASQEERQLLDERRRSK